MKRNLAVEGSYNVRDLGGFAAADGHITRWKVFVRAGDMSKVSGEGCLMLNDYGVKTMIDLRDEWEVKSYPNGWVRATDIGYINLPLIGNRLSQDEKWNSISEKYTHLHELYTYYLDHCQPQIAAIMGAVAESIGGTVFHCYAGKDRTGIIAALVLGAVGVSAEAIAEDYTETNQQIVSLVEEWRTRAVERGDLMQNFERDVAAVPETMMNTLAHLSVRYGGVREYLGECGVTEEQIGLLRERFVE